MLTSARKQHFTPKKPDSRAHNEQLAFTEGSPLDFNVLPLRILSALQASEDM
jgi:hypothetical protein